MPIIEAESKARSVYTRWRSKSISTQRARALLSKLPRCEVVDFIWNTISYF